MVNWLIREVLRGLDFEALSRRRVPLPHFNITSSIYEFDLDGTIMMNLEQLLYYCHPHSYVSPKTRYLHALLNGKTLISPSCVAMQTHSIHKNVIAVLF